MLEKFLHQERAPVFTVLSLLLTLTVSVLLVTFAFSSDGFWRVAWTVVVIVPATLLNAAAGIVASLRGEHRGVDTAACGVALWFLMIAVTFCLGRYSGT
jgi:hypothetical protein